MESALRIRRLRCDGNIVGESPVWCERTQRLFWVDICGRTIHALHPVSGEHSEWATSDLVTSIGLRSDGGAIVGRERDLALWDFEKTFVSLGEVEPDLPDNRLNEGRVGPDGAYWVGTMQNNLQPDGSARSMNRTSGGFYRVWRDGRKEQLTPREYGICNTMAWTPDGRFICADTLANTFYSFDVASAGLTNRRLWAQPVEHGLPDGSALDSEGFLWNCRFGGGRVVRFAPDGSIDRSVELPCSAPTSCAFGGRDLNTLFVTSARFGLTGERARHPDEGGLFAIDTNVPGSATFRFM